MVLWHRSSSCAFRFLGSLGASVLGKPWDGKSDCGLKAPMLGARQDVRDAWNTGDPVLLWGVLRWIGVFREVSLLDGLLFSRVGRTMRVPSAVAIALGAARVHDDGVFRYAPHGTDVSDVRVVLGRMARQGEKVVTVARLLRVLREEQRVAPIDLMLRWDAFRRDGAWRGWEERRVGAGPAPQDRVLVWGPSQDAPYVSVREVDVRVTPDGVRELVWLGADSGRLWSKPEATEDTLVG